MADTVKPERLALTIGYNNAAVNDPCAICGQRTDPSIPLAIYEQDTREVVCDACAREHAPELYWLLCHYYRTVTERDFQGDAYEAEIQKLLAEVSVPPSDEDWF